MTICLMRWIELCMMPCQLSRELLNQTRYPAVLGFRLTLVESNYISLDSFFQMIS